MQIPKQAERGARNHRGTTIRKRKHPDTPVVVDEAQSLRHKMLTGL